MAMETVVHLAVDVDPAMVRLFRHPGPSYAAAVVVVVVVVVVAFVVDAA